MPIGYMGRSGASMANFYASKSDDQPKVEPLKPGEDPLEAIDPETRDSIVNWESTPAEGPIETSLGDRVVAGLTGAAMGAFLGFIVLNGFGSRRYRAYAAKPMNAQASLVWAGIGAAIGGISGFARGRSPLERAPAERVAETVGGPPSLGASSAPANVASHPAFASLHG